MNKCTAYIGRRAEMRMILWIALLSSMPFITKSQIDTAYERSFQESYDWRIQQRVLNGVYIPEDLQEAFTELERLAEEGALDKFRSGSEDEVAERLHFGLGKWIIVNWGLYEGSRFSHYLKGQGLSHPDDMAQYVIRSFHRYLNKNPLESDALIETLRKQRAEEYRSTHRKDTIVIDQEKN